ncbi:hypothetical protein pmac_cds_851 [Pandoravirus macleodensis]|uniref:Ankyrin repeat domain containing protein n=1 Tax=Pandoravirus macleodensis TaxID=2107707 RepID=A0A2U7UG94_9VIRU|nr:hypothetical protein pmac_cds_851 [Pandoravirus macleodensis]AVK77539.1 hypothetical protein pmac_cds_851 [Pandoravirus macleodensis]
MKSKRDTKQKRPRTADEFKAVVRTLRAPAAKKACSALRRPLYETPPTDGANAFDMLPVEMVRDIMMRIPEWRDVVAFQATARRFTDVLAPCDTWTRKYAPDTPFDLTAPPPGACPEPFEAFLVVHARWGMAARGFNADGLVRLAAAGRTDALMWLDPLYSASERAEAQIKHIQYPAWAEETISSANRHMAHRHQDQARAAAKAGHTDTLDRILSNDPKVIRAMGAALIRAAVASNRADTVDVVHRFLAANGARHEWCGSALRARLPATDALEPMTVMDHLVNVGCPTATDINGGSLGLALANGIMGLVVWLHRQARVPQHRCTRRNVDDAASRGHFAAVRWAHEQGMRRCALSTLVAGVGSRAQGTLDFVRWALGQEDPSQPPRLARVPEWRDGLLAIEAARAGAVDVVRWLYENHPETVTAQAARAATTACHADVAIYLHRVGVAPFDTYRPLRRVIAQISDDVNRATGHPTARQAVAALDALAAAGAPYDAKALEQAAASRHAPTLGVFAKHYCVPGRILYSSESPTASGAWPRKAACALPTLDDIMLAAARSDHLETIRWVKNSIPGARLCLAIDMMRAARQKHTRINALGKCSCSTCKPARS